MSEAVYTVEGMTCDHCVHAVSSEVSSLEGVTGVDIDLGTGRVRISSDRPLDGGAVRAAVAEAGYQVVTT